MKKLLNILLVLVLALSLALPALAEEAEAPAPQIVDAKVITYVTDEARTVAAVRIEYDQPSPPAPTACPITSSTATTCAPSTSATPACTRKPPAPAIT